MNTATMTWCPRLTGVVALGKHALAQYARMKNHARMTIDSGGRETWGEGPRRRWSDG